jgi:RNA polymerase sigma factor (sigma-70 family)
LRRHGIAERDVPDLRQEALKALGPEVEKPKAYLWQTTSNLISDHWRARAEFALFCEKIRTRGERVERSHEVKVDLKIRFELLLEVAPELSKEYREILLLQQDGELTEGEIAQRLAISPDAAKARLRRAQERFDELIRERKRGLPQLTSPKAPVR